MWVPEATLHVALHALLPEQIGVDDSSDSDASLLMWEVSVGLMSLKEDLTYS